MNVPQPQVACQIRSFSGYKLVHSVPINLDLSSTLDINLSGQKGLMVDWPKGIIVPDGIIDLIHLILEIKPLHGNVLRHFIVSYSVKDVPQSQNCAPLPSG